MSKETKKTDKVTVTFIKNVKYDNEVYKIGDTVEVSKKVADELHGFIN